MRAAADPTLASTSVFDAAWTCSRAMTSPLRHACAEMPITQAPPSGAIEPSRIAFTPRRLTEIVRDGGGDPLVRRPLHQLERRAQLRGRQDVQVAATAAAGSRARP